MPQTTGASLMETLRLRDITRRAGVAAPGTAEQLMTTAATKAARFVNLKSHTGTWDIRTAAATAGWRLNINEETGWFPVPNGDLSNIWVDSAAPGDVLSVMRFDLPEG